MARPKAKEQGNWLDELNERYNAIRALPLVAERWYITETTPRRCIDSHWDDWEEPKTYIVSPMFDTKEEATEWMEKMEPDEGNTFEVKHQYLRTFTENRWSDI